MPDFSTILQSPDIRAIVQSNTLERAFHDSLFSRVLFRGEAKPVIFPANVGDTLVFTGVGLVPPNLTPIQPGKDVVPSTYTKEQWVAQLQQYAGSIDSNMPTSIAAIASLFYRNSQQVALQAAQTMNRLVRDKLYNAAESGWTVTNGGQTGVTALAVQRLNGFTTARRPDLSTGSPVLFGPVSTNNPLPVTVLTTTGPVTANVTGFTPTTAGDQIGPGTLTLDTSVTVNARAYVYSNDATNIVRIGGALQVDGIGPTNLLRLGDIRQAVARLRNMNVPEMEDGRFHMHMDPVQENQIFADPENQRLFTALPDHYAYKQFAMGEIMGIVAFRNNECPQTFSVLGGSTATYSQSDPFAGELWSNGTTSGTPLHRSLILGQDAVFEYYQDLGQLITEAGVTGKVGTAQITNNGIEVMADRIQVIIRAPLNRLQDEVSTTWKFIGDWPVRTDAATGDSARYKRMVAIVGGE